uniref:NADH-ubiquinone oxidoreductase chain 5 n=1 Tax=Anodontites trapesialis TaxID=1961152 RepID=A0A1X9JP72_9BIVA|nr:NADH dehydrogenase subunit 5 [Anodontites trapesialis]
MKKLVGGSFSPLYCGVFMYFVGIIVLVFGGFMGGVFSGSSYIVDWGFFEYSSVGWSLCFIFDFVSISFFFLVCLISGSVFLFSMNYMENEVFLHRFSLLVMAFVGSMGLLIFIPSLVSVLIGWDGLGIVSFGLVVYYQNKKSLAAGMLTALVNRVGDVMLILCICVMTGWGEWSMVVSLSGECLVFVCSMFVLGAMTKSAQIPFSSWLPAAMAAPTPVSALVHSSTLVTAGIYLLVRFYWSLVENSEILWFLSKVGMLTLLMAGLGACLEVDLKKVIALSTLSQLGLMVVTISLGYPMVACFHLFTHALFKALLFLCAGSMIHLMVDGQDGRLLGGVGSLSPFSGGCLILSGIALSGMPFLSGFYSKDTILEACLTSGYGYFYVSTLFLGSSMSLFYSIRLSLLGMYKSSSGNSLLNYGSGSFYVVFAMVVLVVGTIFGGWCMQNMFVLFVGFDLVCEASKYIIMVVTFVGASYLLNYEGKMMSFLDYPVSKFTYFMSYMWFLSKLSGGPISGGGMKVASEAFSTLDMGWMEVLGGQGAFSSLGVSIKGFSVIHGLGLLGFIRIFMLVFTFL